MVPNAETVSKTVFDEEMAGQGGILSRIGSHQQEKRGKRQTRSRSENDQNVLVRISAGMVPM